MTLDHDWSVACGERSGTEAYFAGMRGKKYRPSHEELMNLLEANDCVYFKKSDARQFELLEVSGGYCRAVPIYPATENKIADPVWFSCLAFKRW